MKYLRSGGVLIATLTCTFLANNSIQAATTNFNWVAASSADYSVSSDWDIGAVPGGSGPGFNCVALFTNHVASTFAAPDNYWVGQMSLGAFDNTSGSFVMNSGTLLISNTPNVYAVTIGGRSGAGGAGAAAQSPSAGLNSVGSFTMNGGTLTVSRYGSGFYHQDSFMLGLATNSTGTFTLNGGTVNFLCGLEAGVYGAGIVNVNGGVIVDNGWFGVGRGNGSPSGSGKLNLAGGAIYILPNFSGGTVGGQGGLSLDQGCTNATVNISGGVLWVSGIGFNGTSGYNPESRDTLNISGGTIYIGSMGIVSSGTEISSLNIAGGTFHTAHMLGVGIAGGAAGDTNADLLADGTNWAWSATLPVNLTTSLSVNGVSGPGYATFAPEAGRTITLNSVWSGSGGFVVNGPGTVTMAASNAYAGNTTINQGALALSGVGSIANSANIFVAAGATFNGPGGGAVYTLGANQTLSNNGSTATLGGFINTGVGTMALTYASGTPAFTVVNGTLGLSANTTVVINNTEAALAAGSYKIISAGTGGVVTVPASLPGVTVNGGGIAPGEFASLSILNNELYLTVTANQPPVIANVVTNTLYFGSTWQIAITNLASLAGWSDPNGLPLSLGSVGPLSANGTNMMTDGTNIYYVGTLSANDYFNYTISDGTLTAVGTVVLNELDPTAAIPTDTNFVTSLNGMWRFYFERTNYNLGTPPNVVLPPATQPFQQVGYVEGAAWTNLPVPGNWEMYGLSPCTYFVPDDTSGLYRNWIQIPQSWQGRRIYLNFDGVMDGAEVWLNGQPVPVSEPSWNIGNYHESGWTGFQVDLTSQANFGTTNLLAVRVIKSTPADDLETGDYFVLGGIYRPVTLYSVPQTNFADVQVQTHLLGTNSAQVNVTADVSGGDSSTTVAMLLNGVETDTTATNGQAVFTQIINQPMLWSAEFPNLYTLTMELKDANGQVTETVTNRIGIREITITNGVVLLNGKPIKFAGVGTHDSTPTNGSVAGASFWRSEILKMKAANINAIRTCHYPYDSAFYDACDELGMYVSDELPYCWCDNETPAANFQSAFEQRARETVRRDRNHASVMIWAIGNENTAGNNLQVVANLVKSLDPTRPRLVSTFNASTYNVELSDAHYPTIAQMQSDAVNAQSTGHPFIFLENPNTWDERLAADAGMYENWGLAMQRVWNVCEQYSTIPGTFPFEWSDRAVQDPNSNASYAQYQSTGVQQLYYFPASGIHLLKMKGMVDAFRDSRPSVYELQNIYSPVQVSNALTVTSGQVSFPVQNRYSFTDLSYLTTAWQLQLDGRTIASGSTNMSVAPLTTGNMQLSLPANLLAYADTLRLDFLHPNGNDVQTYQFTLASPAIAQVTTNLPGGLPIPGFNLINRSIYNNPTLWSECERYPVSLTGMTVTPPTATNLAQMTSLSATVIGGTTGSQVLGTIQAGFTNNVFSYTLKWTSTNMDVQELGWKFQMPANYDQFSWNRNARWTYYPSNAIGRASGTALPASTNVDVTEMDIPNAFDFNSTKYSCTSASLTSSAGDGLELSFGSQQLFDCRAGTASNGQGYVLYANQVVCPPNDISQNIVSDLTMTLGNGSVVQGSFTVGSSVNSAPVGPQPPSANVPANIVQANDPGQCGAVVNFTLPAQTDNYGLASTNVSPASGSMFPTGVTTVTVIVTDILGDSATNTFTVTVIDTQPPMFTSCAPAVTANANATGYATIPDLTGSVVASDNCSGVTLSQVPPAGTSEFIGTYPVTIWAVDQSGNSNSCTTSFTVRSVAPPVWTSHVPDVAVTILQAKDPYATGYPTASDISGPVTITYNDDRSGLTNCDSTGQILRTWTATDASNNVTNYVQTITVVDTNVPVYASLQGDITVTNDPAECSAVVNFGQTIAMELGFEQDFEDPNWTGGGAQNNPSTDWNDYDSKITRVPSGTDGIVSRSGVAHAVIDSSAALLSDTTGAFCRLGGYSSEFGTGYRMSQDVYINLQDPNVVNATTSNGYGWDLSAGSNDQNGNDLRDFIFHVAAYNSNGVVVAADDNGSADSVVRSTDYRTEANYATLTNSGWYTFQWVFRNTNNVLAVDMIVSDTNGAVLYTQTVSDPGYLISTVVGGHRNLSFTFINADTLAIDNTILERNATVAPSIASGTAFPVGTTTVTNTVTDACGNPACSTFNVTVIDTEPPSANVPANIVQANDPGQCGAVVNFTLPAQTDNCGVASVVATPASGGSFPVGTTPVTVVVTDIHANSATNSFTVTVNDTEPPSVNVPVNIVQANDPDQCGAVVNFTLPAQTDNCGVASVVATPASGSSFPVGTTPVTVVTMDIHGNSATNSFTVTVNDTEPPQIAPSTNIVRGVDPHENYATVNFPTPAASDNCGVLSVLATPPSGSAFPVGTNTVTIVAKDIHGNASSSTFTITVVGLPQITSQPHSLTNRAGTMATFTVTATGPALTYQWFKNHTNALVNGGNISGATTATLTLSNVFAIDRGVYSVMVSNAAGGVASSNATLVVIDPVIVTQPVSITNVTGSNVVFSVTVAGSTPLKYQWHRNKDILHGATNSTLTLNNITTENAASYTVVSTNSYGSVTSAPAMLVVISPLKITHQPTNVVALQGDNVNFSVTVTGGTSLVYQWQKNGTNVPGATSHALALNSVKVSNAGSYQVLVSDPAQVLMSQPATLSVYTSTVPALSLACSSKVVTVTVGGLPTSTYVIQCSTNFVDWQPVQTNTAPFTFTATNSGLYYNAFYRAVYLHR